MLQTELFFIPLQCLCVLHVGRSLFIHASYRSTCMTSNRSLELCGIGWNGKKNHCTYRLLLNLFVNRWWDGNGTSGLPSPSTVRKMYSTHKKHPRRHMKLLKNWNILVMIKFSNTYNIKGVVLFCGYMGLCVFQLYLCWPLFCSGPFRPIVKSPWPQQDNTAAPHWLDKQP